MNPALSKRLKDWRIWVVTSLGLGLAPVAPGTFGTLGGVAIAYGLVFSSNYLLWTVVASVLLYALGRAMTPPIEKDYGKDPGFFVLDEVVGYLITMAWITSPSPLAMGMGFAIFRFFDVLKPYPIKRLEKVGGGHGIMLDDVAAGLYGLAVMALLRILFPGSEGGLWVWGTQG